MDVSQDQNHRSVTRSLMANARQAIVPDPAHLAMPVDSTENNQVVGDFLNRIDREQH